MLKRFRGGVGFFCHAARSTLLLCLSFFAKHASAVTTTNLKIVATQPGISGPVCVRAIIKQSDGSYISGEWGASTWPAATFRGKALSPTNVVSILTGTTTITVGKGPDYLPVTITTNLANAGQTYTINVALQPCLDLYSKGWRGGDAHVHFFHGEGEINRSPEEAWKLCAAGGMNFVSFAEDHYGATVLTRQQMLDTWKAYENSECKAWLGVEEPKNVWGHHVSILYDPWLIRSAQPYNWGIHSVHEQGGVNYPVHPERLYPGRSYGGSYFLYPANNHAKFFPLTALTGHLLDGWSGVSDEANNSRTLTSYFKLLSLDYKIPLLADSDFCMDRVNNQQGGMGFWMSYFYLNGEPLTRASLCNAIRKGRVMATTGPLVLFTIDGAMSGDTLPANGTTRTVRIEASYQFNPWLLSFSNLAGTTPAYISQVDLFRNGQIIRTWNPNTTNIVLTTTINESTNKSYYMVRVLGNDSLWQAGYASPIYFENTPRPRQPQVFKPLIKGRLYDAKTGNALTGTVSCVRYGKTNWAIPTDSQGRFRVNAPIDGELVAKDNSGRTLTRNLLSYEPAYIFCSYLPDNYPGDKGPAVDAFRTNIQEMKWEFPIGWQNAASYVRTNLVGDGVMSNFSIVSAPSATSGKTSTEIVMLLVDKTQVQIGDTINYAAIFRKPGGGTPSEELSIEWRGWDPNYPRIYTKYGISFQYNNGTSGHINLGGGFYMRQGSVVVPSWVGNATPSTAAIKMHVTVRANGIGEEASLLIPLGSTKRQLLVSSTWDGFPAAWGELGVGPCNFFRETTFTVRYADYRSLTVAFNLNGQPITVSPKTDTSHAADADDALFEDRFYYDGQCEPQYRNIPFRDAVRSQPAEPDYNSVALQNPIDTTSPNVALMEPFNGDTVSSPVRFYVFVDDEGLSGVSSATLLIDGVAAVSNTTNNPIVLNVNPGSHTWQIRGYDQAGNSALSPTRTFTVSGTVSTNPIALSSPLKLSSNRFQFRFTSTPGQNYTVQAAAILTNWFQILLTNAATNSVTVVDSNATNSARVYRVLQGP